MKAVSPLVSTAILLVAAIAGGLILYNYIVNTLSAPKDFVSITPVSATMVIYDNGQVQITVRLTCIGTKSAKITGILINPGNITISLSGVVVKPGETISITKTFTPTTPLDPSTKYYVTIYYDNGQATEPIEARVIW